MYVSNVNIAEWSKIKINDASVISYFDFGGSKKHSYSHGDLL
jgi:hypothetical protein